MNSRNLIFPLLAALALNGISSSASAQQSTPGWDSDNAVPTKRSRIEIRDQQEITVDIPGTITSLNPKYRGGIVEAGQVVVELDSTVLVAEVAVAEAKAESTTLIDFQDHALQAAKHKLDSKVRRNAEVKAKTGREIYTPDEIRELELDVVKSTAELKKAKEDQKLAKLELQKVRAQLEQYTRTAGLSGIVTDLHTKSVGSGVRQGDPIMTIVNLDKVTAACDIDMVYEDRVNIGDTVLIRRRTGGTRQANVFGDQTLLAPDETRLTGVRPQAETTEEVFVGTVVHISPRKKTDKENSFEIEAVVANKSSGPGKFALREGSFIEAVVISPEK